MPLELLKAPTKLPHGPRAKPPVLEPSLLRDIFESLADTGLGAIGVGPDSKSNRVGAMLGAALPVGRLGRLGKTENVVQFEPKGLRDSFKSDELLQYLTSDTVQRNPKLVKDIKNILRTRGVVPNPENAPPISRELYKGWDWKDSPKKLGRYPEVDILSRIPSQNRLAMGMSPGKDSIYDEAGRYLGASSKVDPAYQAHLDSSVGKHQPKGRLKTQNMEEAFLEKGIGGLTPSSEMIKQLIKKYSK